MVDSIIRLLETGLMLWLSKEKTKYQDRLIELKRQYYEEDNKPYEKRDNAVLDNVRLELRLLGDSFCSEIGKSGSGH